MVKGGAASSTSPRFRLQLKQRSTRNNVVHLVHRLLQARKLVFLEDHVKVVHLRHHVDVVFVVLKVVHLVHQTWSSRKTRVLQRVLQ